MTRRLIAAAALAALAAAACGPGEVRVSTLPLEEGAFLRLVVDAEADSGAGLSLTTDDQDNPHLAYLRVEKPPAEGEPPALFDPLAPVLPAVMHAHLLDGIWTHSPVAEETKVTADDEVAIALDADGMHHVAWTEGGDVRYTSNAGGSFGEAETVFRGDATGLAIAASPDGAFLSFYDVQDDPEGPGALVRAAARLGDEWQVETAAEADPAEPMTTGIGITDDGPAVAYGSAGETILARRVGERWESESVADGGLGVSLDIDADGNPHVAYYDGDTVAHAHSIDASDWAVSEVADAGAPPDGAWSTSIALADDGVHSVAFDAETGPGFATNAGGDFAGGPVEALEGALRPRVGAGVEDAVYVAAYDPAVPALVMAVSGAEEPLLAAPPETGTTEPIEPTTEPTGPPPCDPEGTELAIAAVNIQFDTDCLAAPAGEDFTIEFDNQEDGVPHNVAIYDSSALAQDVFTGEIFPGPDGRTYDVPAIADPGQLYFQCDVHPNMNGVFVVQ